jgi:2-octaprenyl-6-methoxyphenol hydroxylase
MSIIIAGGGLTGVTLALALAELTQGRLPISLVEATTPDTCQQSVFDGRSIALSAGTCQQLTALKLWPSIQNFVTPIKSILVSEQGGFASTQIHSDEYQLAALGQVIPIQQVGLSLYQRLQSSAGVRIHCPDRVTQVVREQNQVQVQLASGQQLTAQLLVIAGGSAPELAANCGFQWRNEDYQQSALIANVRLSQPHAQVAFEYFTEQGPLALLPLADDWMSLVWCQSPARISAMQQWSDSQFLAELQRSFGWKLGRFIQVGQRTIYPLKLYQAQRIIHHRAVVIGNSAQTLHPIAGQGFNLAMRDVVQLAYTLTEALTKQQDLGAFSVLNQYQQARQPDRTATIALTDSLVRIFSNRYLPLTISRQAALLAMAQLKNIKTPLVNRTLGWFIPREKQ